MRNANYEKQAQDSNETSDVRCFPLRIDDDDLTLCSKGRTYLIAEPSINPQTAAAGMQDVQVQNLPMTLKVGFQSESLAMFQKKIEAGDWSEFSKASAFYFLSCLKKIRGSIDGSNHEIVAEIQ